MPFALLFWLVSSIRRALYRNGWLRPQRVHVPAIVVGNITAGGTGKTPVTIYLASALRERGYKPGIISRGYGGATRSAWLSVSADSRAADVGDEPLLMARRTGCPVMIGKDRVEVARQMAAYDVDVIIADDGMQHYALHRDYEICVIDGARQLGNRQLLPAGPLREVPRRLLSVDQVLVNGYCSDAGANAAEQNALCFELKATMACRLDGSDKKKLSEFDGRQVHAVAGIGNPERFFRMLEGFGMDVHRHPLRDHETADLRGINRDALVFMTEKDAVKLDSGEGRDAWYVPVDLVLDEQLAAAWLVQLESRLTSAKAGHD